MFWYYAIIATVSLLCLFFYMVKWDKQLAQSYTFIMILVTVTSVATLVRAMSDSRDLALFMHFLGYAGVCFMPVAITFCICTVGRLKIPRPVGMLLILIGMLMYALIISNPWTHIYYVRTWIIKVNDITVLQMQNTKFHPFIYMIPFIYYVADIGVIIYCYRNKKNASRKSMITLLHLISMAILADILSVALPASVNLYQGSLVIGEIMLLKMLDRLELYDVDATVLATVVENGDLGCFSLDSKGHYLGCDEVAAGWFPELGDLFVDRPVPKDCNSEFLKGLDNWMQQIRETEGKAGFVVHRGEVSYKIAGGYLMVNGQNQGYRFIIRDNTEEQKYLALLHNYNEQLEEEVYTKNVSLYKLNNHMILSFADLIESRDDSTGHHVKRTSKVIEILVNHMMNEKDKELDLTFLHAVIKAAPMHDLGKLAVDDAILRKPGRFTPEEYAQMKNHAAEGGKIVHKILKGTDDQYFARIAENVAHYHHERFDGSGYPDGLKGEEIPLEARIMAVADVYDALVSKRCYKDSMSFDDSFRLMMDGMGTQFDPRMEKYLVEAREDLEAFYRKEFAKAAAKGE